MSKTNNGLILYLIQCGAINTKTGKVDTTKIGKERVIHNENNKKFAGNGVGYDTGAGKQQREKETDLQN